MLQVQIFGLAEVLKPCVELQICEIMNFIASL